MAPVQTKTLKLGIGGPCLLMGTEATVESLGWGADSHGIVRSHVEGDYLLQFPGKPI